MLTQEDFEACIDRCHRGTVIRLVGEEEASRATTKGLQPFPEDPGADRSPATQSYVAPRPGCQYVVRPGGKATSGAGWAVVIDASRLDPGAFVVDEDAYFQQVMWGSSNPYEPWLPPDGELPASVVSRIGCNTSLDNGRPTAGEWVNTIAAELDTSDQVRRCFEETDAVAYAAPIPPEAVVQTFRVEGEAWARLPY